MTTAPQIIVQLIHIQGGLKGEIQKFSDGTITVGRLASCSLRFAADEPGVSREHSRIEREGNRFKLVDVSKYGTFLNGKQIGDAFLKDGDIIEFGPGGPKASFTMEILEPGAEAPAVAMAAVHPLPAQKTAAPLTIQFGPTIRNYQQLPVVIGSHVSADFLLQHVGILDRHAQILFQQKGYWVQDLTGQNLITVNLRPIGNGVQLNPDDEINCGPRGPIFRFLGEGRLAEVEPEATEPAPRCDPPLEKIPSATPGESNLLARFIRRMKKQ